MSLVELFRRFAQPLNQLAIPYMATGAIAAIVYGEPRLTLDLDLVLKLSADNAEQFAAAFPSTEFHVPPVEVLREEVARPEHGHFNLLHYGSGLRADIYLAADDPLDRWGLAHRRRETVGGEPVWVAPAEYVIIRKLEYYRRSGSTKHLEDIRAILRIRPDLVDLPILGDFLRERGLEPEWEKASPRPGEP
jgi:hypothetical protein